MLKSGRFNITQNGNADQRYNLSLLPGAVRDIYGNENDTITLQYIVNPPGAYANITVKIQSDFYPLIIQLLNEKDLITREHFVNADTDLVLSFLPAGRYRLKAIHDRNGNRKWDTGNYLKSLQPERVFFHEISGDIRINWEYEVIWNIE